MIVIDQEGLGESRNQVPNSPISSPIIVANIPKVLHNLFQLLYVSDQKADDDEQQSNFVSHKYRRTRWS